MKGFIIFFNIGAYGDNPAQNGARTAKDNGWDTPEKAIVGGAKFCAQKYIYAGQESMYESKFDLVGTKYTNQYVQNLQAAHEEGKKYYNGYFKTNALNSKIVIKIPIFLDMPVQPAPKP